MNRILVAVEPNAGSELLVQHSIKLARALNATVYLLHVVPANEDSSYKEKKALGQEYAEESQQLNALAQQIRQQGIETHALLGEGVATEAVLDQAEREQVDLIIVGGAGHNSAAGMLLGDFAHQLVNQTRWPVLLIPLNE